MKMKVHAYIGLYIVISPILKNKMVIIVVSNEGRTLIPRLMNKVSSEPI